MVKCGQNMWSSSWNYDWFRTILFFVIQWIVLKNNSYNKKNMTRIISKKKQKGLEEETLCTLVPESIHF